MNAYNTNGWSGTAIQTFMHITGRTFQVPNMWWYFCIEFFTGKDLESFITK